MANHSTEDLKQAFTRYLIVGEHRYRYVSLPEAANALQLNDLEKLPVALTIVLENLLRHLDDKTVHAADISAMAEWLKTGHSDHEIAFHPARVLMQDFTGVPAVVDLAAMRDAMIEQGGEPSLINPQCAVDLVIDHSVQVDAYGTAQAFADNVDLEMERNQERYTFLRWGQQAFENFRVVPPGAGICHQVNLEYLAQVVWTQPGNEQNWVYPDTVVGTDSHTTMINGIGVLGWGVGGIEAEAAMLGQPISMLIPEVIGVELIGQLQPGMTATDLVLTVTEQLRAYGVVGKFVEFFGEGLAHLPVAERATLANMAPEYGATCGLFPIDAETLRYLDMTGRSETQIALIEAYARAQGLWADPAAAPRRYTDVIQLDLGSVVASLAGPKRPQDRVSLDTLPSAVSKMLDGLPADAQAAVYPVTGQKFSLSHGDVVIAAITSCTNTSNPSVLLAAGLLAQNALAKGLSVKPWVKTSLAPGSKVVTEYLKHAGVLPALETLGFYLVGYGCTTCIGNSGPLDDDITAAITANQLSVCSVLSGNRNFEGRIHPLIKGNWLASPPLVVAFALAGTTQIDLLGDPIGTDPAGQPVFLHDIWPSPQAIEAAMGHVNRPMFQHQYADVFAGDERWQALPSGTAPTFAWQTDSTYIQHPPFFQDSSNTQTTALVNARMLLQLGDSTTTDHISPAGSIAAESAAGVYLQAQGVAPKDFNSFGARRGNHEIMMRGTFANIRIRNALVPDIEGGFTRHQPSGEILYIYDAAMRYQAEGTPLIVVAGKEYGTGSSRDWAAKGTRLLGVRAVIAESFERIHRSNLVGMGVLPLVFPAGTNAQSLGWTAETLFSLPELSQLKPKDNLILTYQTGTAPTQSIALQVRIDTQDELAYYRAGGILPYVLQQKHSTMTTND